MAPHHEFESDINIVDLIKEQLPNVFYTHVEEQIVDDELSTEEMLVQRIEQRKLKLQQLQHQLQQLELEKLLQQQNQEKIQQQIPKQLEQLELQIKELVLQIPRKLYLFVIPQAQYEQPIPQQQRQLEFQLDKLQEQMQDQLEITVIEALSTRVHLGVLIHRMCQEQKLLEHQLKIMQLQQQLEKVEQQQETSHPQLLEEIIQQRQLKGLRLVLEKLQLHLQCMLFQCQIIEPFDRQIVPEPQYQQMVEELQEARRQLQIFLHHLQQLQVKQLLEQVQKEFNKQSQWAQYKLEFFQQLKHYINQIEQHQIQLPPEIYKFVTLIEFLRQILLQQQLGRLHFLFEQFELELQLLHLEEQIDYSIEQLLQQQEQGQQQLEQLQSVKLHLKYTRYRLQNFIFGIDCFNQKYSGDLAKLANVFLQEEELIKEIAEKLSDLNSKMFLQTKEFEIQQELINQLEYMKYGLDKLQQQIEH